MKRKVVLTGATGFVGRHLLDALIKDNHEVICFARDKAKLLSQYPDLRVFELDITQKKHFDRLPVLKGIDAFFHLAAYTPYPGESGNPLLDNPCLTVNLLGTYNVLNYFNKCKANKLIFSSSMCVYGKAEANPVQETHPLKPVKFYGLTKLLAENILRIYAHSQLIILRFSSIYGPWYNRPFFMDKFIDSANNNKNITIYGSGKSRWDNLYIKDAVQAIKKAFDYKDKSGIYNIGSGAGISIKDSVKKIIKIFSESGSIKVTHDLDKEEEDSNLILDISKAKNDFRYVPEYTLDKGLSEIKYQYAASNRF